MKHCTKLYGTVRNCTGCTRVYGTVLTVYRPYSRRTVPVQFFAIHYRRVFPTRPKVSERRVSRKRSSAEHYCLLRALEERAGMRTAKEGENAG